MGESAKGAPAAAGGEVGVNWGEETQAFGDGDQGIRFQSRDGFDRDDAGGIDGTEEAKARERMVAGVEVES